MASAWLDSTKLRTGLGGPVTHAENRRIGDVGATAKAGVRANLLVCSSTCHQGWASAVASTVASPPRKINFGSSGLHLGTKGRSLS